jgi:hypothetical protein
MIVEIQFHDDQGSICPYCGELLHVKTRRIDAESMHRENYETKLYPCVCPQGHFVFVTTEINNTDDEYIYIQRMFAFYQDWEDHVDMTITAGAYEVPLLDSEDDAWQIHLKALKLIPKVK